MGKAIQCPNCGASSAKKIDDTHFTCNFCNTTFEKEKEKTFSEIFDALKNVQFNRRVDIPIVRKVRILPFLIFIFIFVIGIFIFVFSVVNSARDQMEQSFSNNNSINDYWGNYSITEFRAFVGENGPVIWMILNQSSNKLDSAKYMLRVYNPVKKKNVVLKTFLRMSWQESFNIRDYISDILSYKNKVYFLSNKKGISIYDLNSGNLLINNEEFAKKHPEISGQIIAAKNVYYKKAIELETSDGFKFYYFPSLDKIYSEKEHNDYKKVNGKVTGFVFSDDKRMRLFYVTTKQDTLRNSISISQHYLDEYLRNKRPNYQILNLQTVGGENVFFNAEILEQNKNFIIFYATETIDENSAKTIYYFTNKNFESFKWKIPLSMLPGFDDNRQRLSLYSNCNTKEMAIWKIGIANQAFGINLNSGKIIWKFNYDNLQKL